MSGEPEVEVTVTPDDTNEAAEVATATTAAEATVAAGEADNAATDAETAAGEATAAELEAWFAAEQAWQASDNAQEAAAEVHYDIAELSSIAANLVEAARLQAQTQATQQVSEQVVLDDPATAVDESVQEEPPQSQHWLTKQWFGKKK